MDNDIYRIYGERLMKVPCEIILWHILPAIRKEFARGLMKNHGLNQKQVAELLGITPAAVCQYLSDKRGYYNVTDDDILFEIEKSTNILFHDGSEKMVYETCRVCNIIKSKGIVEKIEKEFTQNKVNRDEKI
jgi:predicted transcriptional regulator